MGANIRRQNFLNSLHASAELIANRASTQEIKVLAVLMMRMIELERDGEPRTEMPARHHT